MEVLNEISNRYKIPIEELTELTKVFSEEEYEEKEHISNSLFRKKPTKKTFKKSITIIISAFFISCAAIMTYSWIVYGHPLYFIEVMKGDESAIVGVKEGKSKQEDVVEEINQYFEVYGFDYIPEGFELKEDENVGNNHRMSYYGDRGRSIFISQFSINEKGQSSFSESWDYQHDLINGVEYYYGYHPESETSHLYFTKENTVIKIHGTIDIDEALRIAESINKE
jgi:hypothetical protein